MWVHIVSIQYPLPRTVDFARPFVLRFTWTTKTQPVIAPVRQKQQVSPAGTFLVPIRVTRRLHRLSLSVIHGPRITPPSLKFLSRPLHYMDHDCSILAWGNFVATNEPRPNKSHRLRTKKSPESILHFPILTSSGRAWTGIDPRNRFRREIRRLCFQEHACKRVC
ncbi:uncharacterized protein BT62DRAFT_245064 [Guyanagaster necrorhizus]|uniref:Uncharacterized protein n=1 Tax=Guyanagaster necrorhizus TaxID=856835 RepID=A0A9P7VR66_9AGAR|nr:uncharacterized protein BT62DRAFT_245064 [Guyanagaster necrorhizus MCA 3950]KAG7444464.1 hypothetical protein BT62DRAFT_245064 [Guyanagaster necrorhizus MCA 3950]